MTDSDVYNIGMGNYKKVLYIKLRFQIFNPRIFRHYIPGFLFTLFLVVEIFVKKVLKFLYK